MSNYPWIVAHRGCSACFPENTLPAFEQALALPVDAVEFDLRMTRDRKIVVLHDASVDRTSDGSGPAGEKTLAELKNLDVGRWKGEAFAGTRIPEFHELLDLVDARRPDIFLCVELKEDDPDFVRRVLAELERRGRLRRCSIISFCPDALRLANDFAPDLQLHGFENPSVPASGEEAYFARLRRIGIPLRALTPERAAACRERGLAVDTWPVDTRADWEKAVALGVDFATSNNPAEILPLRPAARD